MHKIIKVKISFGRYALQKPFRISSGVIREVPQMFVEANIVSGSQSVKGLGHNSIGLLWADPRKLAMQEKEHEFRASARSMAEKLRGFSFTTPFDFYKKFVLRNKTRLPNLAYVMALSPIDLALWDAYAKLKGKNIFALPEVEKRMDYGRPRMVRVSHLVGMDDPVRSIIRANKNEGVTHFKIKLGGKADADARRVNYIAALGGVARLTADANEAYGSPADLKNFVSQLNATAFRKLLLIEQPFLRNSAANFRNAGIAIPLFADESYATHRDVKKLQALGYRGAALKPHTKTFSGTLLALDALRKLGMSWTVMDLTTAPPLGYFVGLGCGSMLHTVGGTELNGRQYYKNWPRLCAFGFDVQNKIFLVHKGRIRPAGFFKNAGWGIAEAAFKKYQLAAEAH